MTLGGILTPRVIWRAVAFTASGLAPNPERGGTRVGWTQMLGIFSREIDQELPRRVRPAPIGPFRTASKQLAAFRFVDRFNGIES